MILGKETASVENWMMSGARVAPIVGMGCTILMWTDRKAATIVRITRTAVFVQEDVATRTDRHGMSESQAYSYARNPDAPIRVFRLRKNGEYRDGKRGGTLMVGVRKAYHDYSF